MWNWIKNLFRSENDFMFYLIVYNEGILHNKYLAFDKIPFKYSFFNERNVPLDLNDYTFICMNNISTENIGEQIENLTKIL